MNRSEKFTYGQITVVENGYAFSPVKRGGDYEERRFVFESFKSLVDWLKENLADIDG